MHASISHGLNHRNLYFVSQGTYWDISLNLKTLHLFGGIISALVGLPLGLAGCGILGELLGVREELRSTGDVLAQDLWDLDTLDNR